MAFRPLFPYSIKRFAPSADPGAEAPLLIRLLRHGSKPCPPETRRSSFASRESAVVQLAVRTRWRRGPNRSCPIPGTTLSSFSMEEKALKDFVQAKSHVADGVGLGQDWSGSPGSSSSSSALPRTEVSALFTDVIPSRP